jgi:hypothetical protein
MTRLRKGGGMKKRKKKVVRNPIAVAMSVRHGTTSTRMRDRRIRRPNDTGRSAINPNDY